MVRPEAGPRPGAARAPGPLTGAAVAAARASRTPRPPSCSEAPAETRALEGARRGAGARAGTGSRGRTCRGRGRRGLQPPGASPAPPPGPPRRRHSHLEPEAPTAPELSTARLIGGKRTKISQDPAVSPWLLIGVLVARCPEVPPAGRGESCGRVFPGPRNAPGSPLNAPARGQRDAQPHGAPLGACRPPGPARGATLEPANGGPGGTGEALGLGAGQARVSAARGETGARPGPAVAPATLGLRAVSPRCGLRGSLKHSVVGPSLACRRDSALGRPLWRAAWRVPASAGCGRRTSQRPPCMRGRRGGKRAPEERPARPCPQPQDSPERPPGQPTSAARRVDNMRHVHATECHCPDGGGTLTPATRGGTPRTRRLTERGSTCGGSAEGEPGFPPSRESQAGLDPSTRAGGQDLSRGQTLRRGSHPGVQAGDSWRLCTPGGDRELERRKQ
ncbi:collagen alpha-1(II) chain-like [Mustela lutreola]|uniref:collagen alpha-1(II) chain-like n=1 Tax=Mustela lutreola TaxID=9666 RepID=UPI002796FBE0|nr:collagen alpha-1(II) chain-like [Mustela lutreola]